MQQVIEALMFLYTKVKPESINEKTLLEFIKTSVLGIETNPPITHLQSGYCTHSPKKKSGPKDFISQDNYKFQRKQSHTIESEGLY
jgi:hypothetical protein